METQMQQPKSIWAGYILLVLFSFSLYFDTFIFAGLVALIMGYILRRNFRKQGEEMYCKHASWQINTVWLTMLLLLIAFVAIFCLTAWMGSDPTLETKLQELQSQGTNPMEMMRRFWDIPGSTGFFFLLIVVAVIYLIYPLKRSLQGIIALRSGVAPTDLTKGRYTALILATLIQITGPVLVLLLW